MLRDSLDEVSFSRFIALHLRRCQRACWPGLSAVQNWATNALSLLMLQGSLMTAECQFFAKFPVHLPYSILSDEKEDQSCCTAAHYPIEQLIFFPSSWFRLWWGTPSYISLTSAPAIMLELQSLIVWPDLVPTASVALKHETINFISLSPIYEDLCGCKRIVWEFGKFARLLRAMIC